MDQRPTKKQRELLSFIDGFIKGNGYGPSYREVMRALDYKSVSTVAIHINGLISRGYLLKKTNSARSLEVVAVNAVNTEKPVSAKTTHIKWLKAEVEKRENSNSIQIQQEYEVLKGALEILDQPEVEQV